jgi:2-polyprenyl-3-methyl-5-hydroxy-6-metoxy-1,4-benzoquinol methylase
MVHHDHCPLCSSEMINAHFTCIDHFISKESFALARCNRCGFLFTQDYPDQDEVYKYYESDNYISHSDTSEGIINKIYHLIRHLMLRRKRRILNRLTGLRSGRLLDVGSGTGHFASMMKKSGWVVKGIEISEKARNFSASTFDLEIISPQQISELNANSFDCVTMWHVLEHFHDPFRYVSDIIKLLKPGGVCLVALPNCSSFDAKFYNREWAAYDVPRHLWHFDPDTFDYFSGKAGLKVEHRLVLPFDVFYICVLSEKYQGSRSPFIKGITRAFWFSLLTVFERNRSSSIIYVLRKPVDNRSIVT